MTEINFFWHGGPMADLNKGCIRSWAEYGFKPLLWSYDGFKLDFAESRDAREVMPLEKTTHPALFADGFRYKLLHDRGGYWMDSDIICNTNELIFAETTVASEMGQTRGTWQTNCFMFATQGCKIMGKLCDEFEKIPRPLVWGSTGPVLLTKLAMQHQIKTLPSDAFCPVPWWEFRRFGRAGFQPDLSNSLGVHLWHEMWRRHGGLEYDRESLIGRLNK